MIGQNIRNLRKSQNLTLQQLAARIGTDTSNLSRIERGEIGISETLLRATAQALNTTPGRLYDADLSPSNLTNTPPAIITKTNSKEFVHWFRSAAPYIHAFGGSTFVIAFGGEVVSEADPSVVEFRIDRTYQITVTRH